MSAKLIFGQPIPQELLDEYGIQVVQPSTPKSVNGKRSYAKKHCANPCVQIYGPGPENAVCRNCTHLVRRRYSKTYIKCKLRGITNGPATDHYATWPACGRYEMASIHNTTPEP